MIAFLKVDIILTHVSQWPLRVRHAKNNEIQKHLLARMRSLLICTCISHNNLQEQTGVDLIHPRSGNQKLRRWSTNLIKKQLCLTLANEI